MEAPTAPWAARAFSLGLAHDCGQQTYAAAAALLEQESDHLLKLLAAGSFGMDSSVPLRDVMRAPQCLHAHALGARLCSGEQDAFPRTTLALQGLCGFAASAAYVDEPHCSAHGGPGMCVAACHGTPHACEDLSAPDLAAAMRALRDVRACAWLAYDGGHSRNCFGCAGHITSAPASVAAMSGAVGDCGNGGAAAAATVHADAGCGVTAGVTMDSDADAIGNAGDTVSADSDEQNHSTGSAADADGDAAGAVVAAGIEEGAHPAEQHGGGDINAAVAVVGDVDMTGDDTSLSSGLSGCSAESSADLDTDPLMASPDEALRLPGDCQAFADGAAHALTSTLAAPRAPLRLRALTVLNQPFSGAQAAALAAALAEQTQLQHLGLRHCSMPPAAVVALLDTAAGLPNVRALELHGMLSHSTSGTSQVLAGLSRVSQLTFLSLNNQLLASASVLPVRAAALTAALKRLAALRHLVLGECCTSTVRGALAAVPHMRRLESICCDSESLRLGPETPAAWGAAAAAAATLTRLTLSWQQTTGSACTAVARLAALTALQHLDLTGTGDTAFGMARSTARALAGALAAMARLTHLNLSAHERFCNAGRFEVLAPVIGRLCALRELGLHSALILCAAMRNAEQLAQHCSGLSALRVLNLNGSSCDDGGIAALRPWLASLPALEELSMVRSGFRGTSAAALCSALALGASVTFLDLSEQEREGWDGTHTQPYGSPGPGLHAFGAALGGLARLQVLNLSNNAIDFDSLGLMGAFEEGLGELQVLSLAGNVLCAAAFRLLGERVAGLPKLTRLDVSAQQTPEGVGVGLKLLLRALRAHRAPEQILVVAHECAGGLSKAQRARMSQDTVQARLQGGAVPRVEL